MTRRYRYPSILPHDWRTPFMSLQGPIVVVGEQHTPALIDAISAAGAFPVIESSCADAAAAITAAHPSAIVLADAQAAADDGLAGWLAREITRMTPIVPVVVCSDPKQAPAYRESLSMAQGSDPQAVAARIASALRVRSLHAALLRRAETAKAAGQRLPQAPDTDPLEDATVILAGRGRSYPQLSVGLGEHTGLIGVLTIEVAARYLKQRDADGLVIGDGFDPRNVEAMLTVMAEDSRFRDLPVGVLGRRPAIDLKRLPHIVYAADAPGLVTRVLPLIRLHAFEARLRRTLHAFDKAGIVDPATGLLCQPAFLSELARLLRDAGTHGSSLSVARFAFDPRFDQRARNDAARLVSKLVRGADFACSDQEGSILVAFAETDVKHAQGVAKRLASVLKHTMLHPDRNRAPAAPKVTLTARKSADTVASLLDRITVATVAAE
jgi:hypothetical protein